MPNHAPKYLLLMLCLIIGINFFSGCANRTARPVASYQYGDESKSCEILRAELAQIENQANLKAQKADETDNKNAGMAVVGALLFWPALFAMDMSDSDRIELEALRQRYDALALIAQSKKCGAVKPLHLKEATPAYSKTYYDDEDSDREPAATTDSAPPSAVANQSPNSPAPKTVEKKEANRPTKSTPRAVNEKDSYTGTYKGELVNGDAKMEISIIVIHKTDGAEAVVKIKRPDGSAGYEAAGNASADGLLLTGEATNCDNPIHGCCPNVRLTLLKPASDTTKSIEVHFRNTCGGKEWRGTVDSY